VSHGCDVALEVQRALSAGPQEDAGQRRKRGCIRAIQWVEEAVFPGQRGGDRQLDVEASSQNPACPLRCERNRLDGQVEHRDPSPFHELAHDRRELKLPGVQWDHDVRVPREGQAGPGAKARPMIRVRRGIEEATPSGDQRQVDRLSAEVRALNHLLERRPKPERREGIVVVTLVHGLDGLCAGVEPLADEMVQHEIGEAVVEIRDEPIEVPGELGCLQTQAKGLQEGPGAAERAPPAGDDRPRNSCHLEASKRQRATDRRAQHRLSTQIEEPPARVTLPQRRVRRVAFPVDALEQPGHRDEKRGLVGAGESLLADPALAGPLSDVLERHVALGGATVRQTRRRFFRGPGW
jgi:hypothetical protein